MRHADVAHRVELDWLKEWIWKAQVSSDKGSLKISLMIFCKTPFLTDSGAYLCNICRLHAWSDLEQIQEITAQPFTAQTVTCHDSIFLDCSRSSKTEASKSLLCTFVVAITSYDQHPRSSSFLTIPHQEEHVSRAENKHAFKHHHPVLNKRQAAHCSEMEATRKQKIEKM